MTLDQLDTVVRYVFGCHGVRPKLCRRSLHQADQPLRRGLGSDRGLPHCRRRRNVPTGIYHYNGRGHCLVRMEELAPEEGKALATEFMCGQWYFGAAHVTFVLTARFYRNHWKYRRHPKAYPTSSWTPHT